MQNVNAAPRTAEGLQGKVTMVTGASYGLGRAIAETLGAAGARILATDVDERLECMAEALRARGIEVATARVDVRDRQSVKQGVDRAMEAFGGLDVVVNNAGYSRTTLPLMEMDVAEWEMSMQINVRGALFAIQEGARMMIAGGRRGRIVNIASTAAYRPFRMKSPYCVSKTALVALTRCAALELAEHKITVNAVAPGQTDTETTRLLQNDPTTGPGMNARSAAIPLGGVGRPEDIAEMVAFLASARAGHITGQTMLVDGGTLLV